LNLRNKRYHITVYSRENPILFKKLLNNIANICPNNVSTRMIKKTAKSLGSGALLPLIKRTVLISKKSGHLINIIFSSEETPRNIRTNKIFHITCIRNIEIDLA